MMTIALIEKLTSRAHASTNAQPIVVYFFCQNTVGGLNSADGVLRGLLYFLVMKRSKLLSYVRTEYDIQGRRLFEGGTALYSLWAILISMLKHPNLPRVYLLLDALDECTVQQVELLRLITSHDAYSPGHVKWLLTSRNEPLIKEHLEYGSRRVHTSLELNSRHVVQAVEAFIYDQVEKLVQSKGYDSPLKAAVSKHLRENADGTFLWVALVCRELEQAPLWKTKRLLQKFPGGLAPLYSRMLEQISNLDDKEHADLCRKILGGVTVARRPPRLSELKVLVELPDEICQDILSIRDLVSHCSSFLTIRDDVVYFVHQSAKDFLSAGEVSCIFPKGQPADHRAVFSRCQKLMGRVLKKDVCGLGMPGILVEEVDRDQVQAFLPSAAQYACCFWIDHLLLARDFKSRSLSTEDAIEAYEFLSRNFLYWIEGMSLISKISEGIEAIIELESVVKLSGSEKVLKRRLLGHRWYADKHYV